MLFIFNIVCVVVALALGIYDGVYMYEIATTTTKKY